jgi:ribose transport system permease protein
MGAIAGLAGILFAARTETASATASDGQELKAITAVILGGASLTGGKGTIPGALVGVLFVALVENLLNLAAVEAAWTTIVPGGVLIAAVALDAAMNRRGAAGDRS